MKPLEKRQLIPFYGMSFDTVYRDSGYRDIATCDYIVYVPFLIGVKDVQKISSVATFHQTPFQQQALQYLQQGNCCQHLQHGKSNEATDSAWNKLKSRKLFCGPEKSSSQHPPATEPPPSSCPPPGSSCLTTEESSSTMTGISASNTDVNIQHKKFD